MDNNDLTNNDPVASPTSETPNTTTAEEPTNGVLNDLNDEEVIDLFIEGIMQEKGVDAPTDEIKKDIFDGLKTRLLQEIDRSLVAELPDDKLEELGRMAAANGEIDPNLIAKMIEEAGLNVTEIVGTTMARFRELYLSPDNTTSADQNQPTEE